jgi:hypothetical protein
LTGWLHATTRNVAANVVRDERRRKAREHQAHAMENILHAAAPEAPPDWSRVAPVLDAALDDLREADRQVVLWRYIDRRPFADIGAALRLTEDAARMRVERALEKLRARLARRGISSTSAALGVALAQNVAVAAPASVAALATQAALGAAPLAAGGSVALFFHVTMQAKLTTAVAAGLALLACGTATWQVRAHRAAERELAAARGESAARLVPQPASQSRVAASANPPQVSSSLPVAPAVQSEPEWDETKAASALMDRVPGFRQALIDVDRAQFKIDYAEFFTAEKLTPLQIEDLATMMTAGQARGRMMGPQGRSYNFSPVDGAGRPLEPEKILGRDGAERFDAFDTAMHADASRGAVSQLASALCFSEDPLTVAQAAELKKVLARHQVPYPAVQTSPNRFYWEAALPEAATVLKSNQLEALRGVVATERAGRAITIP